MKTEKFDFKYIGKRRGSIDAPQKLQGKSLYAGDLNFPGMLHARLILSPYAHAQILKIKKEAALGICGVKAVFTASELTHWTKISASRVGAVLARDEVVFTGHPVAVVVAESAVAASDGASLVEVDYEPMNVVASIENALSPEASLVWKEGIPRDESDVSGDHADVKVAEEHEKGLPVNVHSQNHYSHGNVEAGLNDAHVLLERTYTTGSVHQGYIEPQNCVVVTDPMDGLTIYTSTQGPRSVHNDVSRLLKIPHSSIKVIPMTIGGGFGGKHGLLEPTAAAIAMEMKTSVKIELTRSEDFMTSTPAPPCKVRLKMGAKRDGSLCALDATVDVDNGVYAAASWSSLLALLMASGYRIPNFRIHCREVVTHKLMAGAYRAPTAQTAAFAMESHLDELADALGQDPLEFRLQNAAKGGDMMINGKPWPSLGLSECLKTLKEHPMWVNRTAKEDEGWGLAVGLWPCGVSPASAVCRMLPDGKVQLQVGSVDISGINTGFVQIVAEVLKINPEQVEIVEANSRVSPVAPPSGGSQVSYSVAGPVRQASQKMKEQLAKLAAEHFEASEEDLLFEDGAVYVSGLAGKTVSLGELAKKAESQKGGEGPVIASSSESIENNAPAASSTGCFKQHSLSSTGQPLNPIFSYFREDGFKINLAISWRPESACSIDPTLIA